MISKDVSARQEDQLSTRIAWLYYVEGLTQEQIARRLHQNRVKVLRTLAACRQDGTVQIRINSKLAECLALERKLEKTFGLTEAVVVPTPANPKQVSAIVGNALGAWLSDRLQSRQTIGVGWGRTLQASLSAIDKRAWKGQTVVSLLGGLTRAHAMSPFEFAWRFSNIIGADCYYVSAPVYTSDSATRDSLMAQKGLRELFEKAATADIAVVSVGALTDDSTIPDLGLVEREDLDALRASGAVGDLLGHYLKADGSLVDHRLNRCVMAFEPRRLRRIRNVVLASGGTEKVLILKAALATTQAKTLLTDEKTAARLVREG
ncbi:MAG: sugar-binding transcriptional regulator [Proteobacteria bacterium]|nr:sugar-binding transcriptional regulator [Pseudomonadota bacterium]